MFAGSPAFAAHVLAKLIGTPFKPTAVFTQPDRPTGRGRKLTANPVKSMAQAAGLPVEQPTSLKAPESVELLAQYTPEVLIVVAYGLILPQHILDVPPKGCINVHASLLPRWRGAAPIEHAMLAGDQETGVSIMQMEAGLDTGPVYLKRSIPIRDNDSIAFVTDAVCTLGAAALLNVLQDLAAGKPCNPAPQTNEGSSYAPKLTSVDRILDWSLAALDHTRRINALASRMPVRCRLEDRGIQLLTAQAIQSDAPQVQPGTIIAHREHGFDVQCATDILRISELKIEGKAKMDAGAAIHGYPDLFRTGNQLQ